ncbi:hypothetical protein NL676_021632 [Syzygium grande]|nr:hypothetical protein NL676_021632 [Syzygium grande]
MRLGGGNHPRTDPLWRQSRALSTTVERRCRELGRNTGREAAAALSGLWRWASWARTSVMSRTALALTFDDRGGDGWSRDRERIDKRGGGGGTKGNGHNGIGGSEVTRAKKGSRVGG